METVEPLRLSFYDIALMGAGLGLLLGLFPLILGFVKGKIKLGLAGLIGSALGGSVLGVFLSIPIIAVCVWLILKKPQSDSNDTAVNDNQVDVNINNFENR